MATQTTTPATETITDDLSELRRLHEADAYEGPEGDRALYWAPRGWLSPLRVHQILGIKPPKRTTVNTVARGEGDTATIAVYHTDDSDLDYDDLGAEWDWWPADSDVGGPSSRVLAVVTCPLDRLTDVCERLESDPVVGAYAVVAEGPRVGVQSLPWRTIGYQIAS